MSNIDAIVFDFDGVLVESVEVKGYAFVKLYEHEHQDIQDAVLQYHVQNGGVTRFDKIRYYEEELCGRTVDDDRVKELGDGFGEIVERLVIESQWVAGAKDFLEKHYTDIPLYVASATPEEELLRIIKARNMNQYFKAVYGAPITKDVHLQNIIEQNGYETDRVAMIGDAMTDYNAAKTVGTRFVGRRLPEKGNVFPDGAVLIDDLTTLDEHL